MGIDCGLACAAEFENGVEVTLSASAGAGSVFTGWSGAGCSGTGACKVTMTEARSVTAEFSDAKVLSVQKVGAGLGSVMSSPAGIRCMETCESAKLKFPDGTPARSVVLTATPYKGSTFVGWGGDCSGKASTCQLTLSAGKSVTAEFAEAPKVDLTLDKVSGVGTVKGTPASINCAAACSTQTWGFYEGDQVTLTATPGKSTFLQWSGACSGSSSTCKVTMDEAKTVGAEFSGSPAGNIPLTLKKAAGSTGTGKVVSYPGGVTCAAGCTAAKAVFKPGAKVVLKQTASKGSAFVEWGGSCAGAGVCEVTLSEALEVTAEFEAIPAATLTVTKTGGTGTVKSASAGVNCGTNCLQASARYPQATSVALTAVPGKGSGSVQWTGCDEISGGLCTVTVGSAKEVTAKFE
jgi:hypothetical protein